MILHTLVFVFLGVSTMVSGLELCDEPVPGPEIIKLSATPVLNAMNRLVEVEATVQLKSSVPLRCRWASYSMYRETDQGTRFASQDSQDFTSSEENSGDMYTFKVRDKLSGYNNNISKVLEEYMINLDVGDSGSCNVYFISMWWLRMKKMHEAGVQFPTVLQMPRIHNIVNDDQPQELMTVLSPITQDVGEFDFSAFCYETYVRVNGKLEFTQRNGYESKGNVFKSVIQERQDDNIGRGCTVTLGGSVESLLMPFTLSVARGRYGEPDYFNFRIYLDVELRRHNVQAVALTVTGGDRAILRKDGVFLVTTYTNTTELKCMADASPTPTVTAMRYDLTNGVVESLPQQSDQFLQIYKFHRYAVFKIESQRATNGEVEYVCYARSGSDGVISQKIKVVRYGEVKLKDEQLMFKNADLDDKETMTVSCETTSGDPQPAIRFYGSPPKNSWSLPGDYFQNNYGYEIVNSTFFNVETTTKNGQAKGTLTIKNMNNATPADLKGYSVRWGSYKIVCVAYNKYGMASENLAFWFL